MNRTLGSPDVTQIDFCWLCKDNIYIRPLPTTIDDLQTRIREACAKLIAKFSVTCGGKFHIIFVILVPLMTFVINFVKE
jgi:hypothetical protein